MGLLNSALQIGRSAILGYEGALHVVGNNISGAGSPDYTRQSPRLDPVPGRLTASELQPGAGVALTDIQRNIDDALEGRIRLALGMDASLQTQESALGRLESMFDDLTGTGVGTRLSEFFAAFDDLQNTPEDLGIRELAINRGVLLAQSLRDLRQRLTELGDDLDSQIGDVVSRADELARQIAALNEEIVRAEGGRSTQASALRDQRDGLLRELGKLMDVVVREQPDGTVNVYVGNEALIQGSSVRGLIAEQQTSGGVVRTSVRFADTGQEITPRGGELHGLLVSRDQNDQIQAVDELAAAVIEAVNRIHADGQGLVGFTDVTGAQDVLDATVPLDSGAAGLPSSVQNGSFYITVMDEAGQAPQSFRIDVQADGTENGTTLEDLAAAITEQVDGVTASVTGDRRLRIQADEGFSFVFGFDGQSPRADTSGVLAALGINTFFTGKDASDIAVNESLQASPALLAAGSSFLPGDGSVAGRISSLDVTTVDRLGGATLQGFYDSVANRVAVVSSGVQSDREAASTVLRSLQAQREAISGVNLDEEAISLVKFQRAFQGTARFVAAVDEMLAQLLLMLR